MPRNLLPAPTPAPALAVSCCSYCLGCGRAEGNFVSSSIALPRNWCGFSTALYPWGALGCSSSRNCDGSWSGPRMVGGSCPARHGTVLVQPKQGLVTVVPTLVPGWAEPPSPAPSPPSPSPWSHHTLNHHSLHHHPLNHHTLNCGKRWACQTSPLGRCLLNEL